MKNWNDGKNNEYDEAFQLFKEASEVERGVQSLNNLAWIYLNEEADMLGENLLAVVGCAGNTAVVSSLRTEEIPDHSKLA